MITARAARVQVGGLEHRADAGRRPLEFGEAGGRRRARGHGSARRGRAAMRSVVVFPAPFGPRKPVTLPASTLNDSSSTAVTSPKRLVNSTADKGADMTSTPERPCSIWSRWPPTRVARTGLAFHMPSVTPRSLAGVLGNGAIAIEADVTDRDSIVAAATVMLDVARTVWPATGPAIRTRPRAAAVSYGPSSASRPSITAVRSSSASVTGRSVRSGTCCAGGTASTRPPSSDCRRTTLASASE